MKLTGLGPAFCIVVLLAGILGGVIGLLFATDRTRMAGTLAIALILGWFIFELITGIILYTYAEFLPVAPPPGESGTRV